MHSRKVNSAGMGKCNSKACCNDTNITDLSTVLRSFQWTATWKIDHWTHLNGTNTSELTSKVFYPDEASYDNASFPKRTNELFKSITAN